MDSVQSQLPLHMQEIKENATNSFSFSLFFFVLRDVRVDGVQNVLSYRAILPSSSVTIRSLESIPILVQGLTLPVSEAR